MVHKKRQGAEGARVGVLDLRQEDAAATVALLEDPSRHLALACNVADSAAIDAAFAQVHAALGGLHIVVNNAGTGTGPNDGSAEMYAAMAQRNAELAAGGPAKTFVDQTMHMADEGWRGVMGVNLDGAFWGCRAAIRLMAQDGHGGSLINISSTSAQSGEGSITSRTVEIRERYEEVPPINLNRELLEWVLENLLSNALTALDKPQGLIEVVVERRAETEEVEISVSDNGRGMTRDEQRRVFVAGYSTKRRGWGLGLALARRVVEEYHAGRIGIRSSAPGEGTTMVIRFPT